MNEPVNHHFVPQHFLRAWSIPVSDDHLIRFRVIPDIDKFEVRQVAIKSSASQENLYRVSLPDGAFEIESCIVTPNLDAWGHLIIDRIRSVSYGELSDSEKRDLAVYLVCLEARHPDTLKVMDVREKLGEMRQKLKTSSAFSANSIDEVVDYLQASPSTGVMSLAEFIKNERGGGVAAPFSDAMLRSRKVEFVFEYDALITSDFPCFRMGDYMKSLLYVIAVSPRKALIYSTEPGIEVFQNLRQHESANVLNFYTLGNARRAYASSKDSARFVEKILGWSLKCPSVDEKRACAANAIKTILDQGDVA